LLGEEPKEDDIKQLLKDAEKYTLASHLFWGLWGIISVRLFLSPIQT
jgi:choline/ethanolamine kinase